MLAARVCRLPISSVLTGVTRQVAAPKPNGSTLIVRVQKYADKPGFRTARRFRERMSVKERVLQPAGEGAFTLGKGAVAGASALGLGALCYYGLGLSNEVGALEKSALWPQEVKQRVRDTYMYFTGSLGLTAASAVFVSRTPALMNLAMRNSWLALGATFALMIGSGMVVRSIPYKEGFGSKQMAWMVHSGIMGLIIAPITLLGGPLMVRAACYTAGVVGALSTVAMCAPSEKFLNIGGPLAIGLGLVFASSIGSMFVSPGTALGAGMYSMSVYGGAVLFGLFLLYDTQKIIKAAETYPVYADRPFDPINASVGIYLDTLNLFIRIAMMLANGGGRKK